MSRLLSSANVRDCYLSSMSSSYPLQVQEFRDKDVDIASYVLFGLNSKDRNTASGVYNSDLNIDNQPWNNFRVQKPAPLLDAYAKRIGVSELRFPWSIPNITSRNNVMGIEIGTNPVSNITIPVGFYNGTQLATAINTAITALGISNSPTVSYNTATYTFTWTAVGGQEFAFYVNATQSASEYGYYVKASLVKSLGININQLGVAITTTFTGAPTQILYTSYVDIVSSKLHYNNKIKDGNSALKLTTDVLVRLYCANEVSTEDNWTTGQTPFLIHRQFRTPKMLRWNSDAFIDWFDIQILDEYGDLVYINNGVSPLTTTVYPDFQITFMASEC
jgi:hypothetical protein